MICRLINFQTVIPDLKAGLYHRTNQINEMNDSGGGRCLKDSQNTNEDTDKRRIMIIFRA